MGATSRCWILHWHTRFDFLSTAFKKCWYFRKSVLNKWELYLKLRRCATERVSVHPFALTLRSLLEEWKRMGTQLEREMATLWNTFNRKQISKLFWWLNQVFYVIQSFLLIISTLNFGRHFNSLYFKFEFWQIRLIKRQFESFSDGWMCMTWSVRSLRGQRGSGYSQCLFRSLS